MSKNSFKKNVENAKFANFASSQSDHENDFPSFPDEVYQNLPECLKRFLRFGSRRENDMFLNALLPVLGLSMFKLSGNYANRITYGTLYSLNCAPPASGKGVQNFISDVINVLEEFLIATYPELDLKQLLLPGNSSSAAVMEFLTRNKLAVMNETEMDVLSLSINQEWGDFTAILRQGYEGETISINRKDNNYAKLNDARLSVTIAGTEQQFVNFFRSAENGMFSRFIIYRFRTSAGFKNVKPDPDQPPYKQMTIESAQKLIPLLKQINSADVEFTWSDSQWDRINSKFSELVKSNRALYGEHGESSIIRLAPVYFKISMITSALRHAEQGSLTGKIVCDDADFMIAGKMINVYYANALKFLEVMPGEADKIKNRRAKVLFESLPATFTTGEAKEIAANKNICSPRSVDNFLIQYQKIGLIEQTKKYGTYQKVKTE